MNAFVGRFRFRFDAIYTREDGPPKPSPAGARALCEALGVPAAETLAIGDYKYDVMAARGAGCRAALVRRPPPDDLVEWGSPDLVVGSLRDLLPLWAEGSRSRSG